MTPDELDRLIAIVRRPDFEQVTTPRQRIQIAGLLEAEALVRREWRRIARPNQLRPGTPGSASDRDDWLVWLILAGRGFGKTRSGAEDVAEFGMTHPQARIALVASTFADGRDTMVEGESGLLHALGGEEGVNVRLWNRSQGLLVLRNGARYQVYSSEKPRKLRGPQHHYAWVDELPEFADADSKPEDDSTWSNLLFGLRLGERPRVVVTCTPKPVKILKALIASATTVITRGTTWENLSNLASTYRETVVARYEGTRLGAQELEGLLLEAVEGALWTPESLERYRVMLGYRHVRNVAGGPRRTVVAVDPSIGDGSGDECGIVVACLAGDGNVYVLADHSLSAPPSVWAAEVANTYHAWEADYVVAEANQGGLMVRESLLRAHPNLPVRSVWGKAGKRLRAEPVSLLHDQGRIWLAGRFPELEESMTTWRPLVDSDSPDRLDAFVYAVLDLLPVESGASRVRSSDVWEGVR